jgi:hypothetical protein
MKGTRKMFDTEIYTYHTSITYLILTVTQQRCLRGIQGLMVGLKVEYRLAIDP